MSYEEHHIRKALKVNGFGHINPDDCETYDAGGAVYYDTVRILPPTEAMNVRYTTHNANGEPLERSQLLPTNYKGTTWYIKATAQDRPSLLRGASYYRITTAKGVELERIPIPGTR